MSGSASPESSVPVASVPPAAPNPTRARFRRVLLAGKAVVLPSDCACCGEPDTGEVRVRRGQDAAELLVGYCDACLAHAHRDGTRVLGVALASLLLALTVSVASPLLGVVALTLHLGATLGAALVPLAIAWLLRPRPARGHSAWGSAVTWSGPVIACSHDAYAEALLKLNPRAREIEAGRGGWFSPWMLAGLMFGVSAAWLTHELYFPSLRVLNLTGERFALLLDGRVLATVEPTSVESPAAGRELRVPAGEHTFEVRSSAGDLLARQIARTRAGKAHLYAPASEGFCFWLETRSYGRGRAGLELHPLEGPHRFYALPDGIDAWFTAPATPGVGAGTLSGGAVTALRQAPCEQAPEQVRP